MLNSRVKAVEDKVANGFIEYIAGVKHLFLHYRDVPQAVLEAADGLSIEIIQVPRLMDAIKACVSKL